MQNGMFQSFIMGGFECSTHRNSRGKRLDLIESTRHEEFAEADYSRMIEIGMKTARDGVRWHLIEKEPFQYDFSSLEEQVAAAKKTGIEIIWDYFHYGFPDDLDIFSKQFIERFASFCEAVTIYLKNSLGAAPIVCPVNEISFFSWIAGDKGVFYPCAKRRGDELKIQLVRAGVAAIDEIKMVSPDSRCLFTDPAINVVPKDQSPASIRMAESYRLAQFEAFDMLSGMTEPQLGGGSERQDLIGLNYYFHNQWRHPSRRKIPLGHPQYKPLSEILVEFYERYQKPILIAETGIEDDERAEWFRYICEQTRAAQALGVPIEGICLYPIANHPGWVDNRHCHNGLWDYPDKKGERLVHKPLADEIAIQLKEFEHAAQTVA